MFWYIYHFLVMWQMTWLFFVFQVERNAILLDGGVGTFRNVIVSYICSIILLLTFIFENVTEPQQVSFYGSVFLGNDTTNNLFLLVCFVEVALGNDWLFLICFICKSFCLIQYLTCEIFHDYKLYMSWYVSLMKRSEPDHFCELRDLVSWVIMKITISTIVIGF